MFRSLSEDVLHQKADTHLKIPSSTGYFLTRALLVPQPPLIILIIS